MALYGLGMSQKNTNLATRIIEFRRMKRLFTIVIMALSLLFACTPENNNNGGTKESTIPAGAVDLGIVMTRTDGITYKLYWAQSNLSTSGLCASPEDYGDYYAWGETEPKENYSWSTYKWCNGSSSTLTKYNNSSSYGTVDNKMVLESSDDVASVKLGGKWRMPTDAEWTELRTKCKWTWTDNYNGTGVAGRIVSATNGNSIFLPAAGYRHETSLDNAGSVGIYWSASLFYTDLPFNAWNVGFWPVYVDRSCSSRCDGRSVRPVTE